MALITLLTDFGDRDAYVGVMKGVMLALVPDLHLIDLSHQIAPQDLWAAQFIWGHSYAYFAPDVIHVAVVDPGVGTARRAIALHTPHGYFIAPDNGLLTPILQQEEVLGAIALDHPQYWRTTQPSWTFHGRDIFAPVAAHLARGVPFDQLGTSIDAANLVQLPIAPPDIQRDRILGQVQYIDHFGNCVSTIPGHCVADQRWSVQLPNGQRLPASRTYGDRAVGEFVALIGSHGYVEVAQNQGSAQTGLNWHCGSRVEVILTREIAPLV
jgi:hypothetical protein